MNWPWIARAVAEQRIAALSRDLITERAMYDGVVTLQEQKRTEWLAALENDRTRHIAELTAANARYDALLDKYHALKVSGATIPEPVTPLERKQPDALEQAVSDASRGKPPALVLQMRRQLAQDRKNIELGMDTETDVLARITHGVAAFGGVP